MNIQNIKNSTLAKLTNQEVQDLGFLNEGVGLYCGDLKTRYGSMKRQKDGDNMFWFEGTEVRIEFVKLQSQTFGRQDWAARMYDKIRERYYTDPMGIVGCDFIR